MSAIRRGLMDVTEKDLAFLIPHFKESWTEALRDFAASHFLTLASDPRTKALEPEAIAELAVQLTFGISEDLGGTQPYIAAGANLKHEQRKAQVLELLAEGKSYGAIGRKCGITADRVRKIERETRIKERKEEKPPSTPAWREEAQAQTDGTSDAHGPTNPTRPKSGHAFPAWPGR